MLAAPVLEVHLPCGNLRGDGPNGRQGCPCDPAPEWSGHDAAEYRSLCSVCGRGTCGGSSRYSWLGCDHCLELESALQRRLGLRVLPLGRHSVMNAVLPRVEPGQPGDDDVVRALMGRSRGWSNLSRWGPAEVRRLADSRNWSDRDAVPLEEWLEALPSSAAASHSAYRRCLGVALPDGLSGEEGEKGEKAPNVSG